MFQEIKVDYQGKPKRLNHRNVKSYSDLNLELSKAYLMPSKYSLWYQYQGELLSIQNEYDFSNLNGIAKLKIIVLAQQIGNYQTLSHEKSNKKVQQSEEPTIKQPVKPSVTIIKAQEECEQCQNFRKAGFPDIICLDCQKKNMAARFPPKGAPKTPQVRRAKEQPVITHEEPRFSYDLSSRPVQKKVQKPVKQSQNKPKIKIPIKPDQTQQFSKAQQMIGQFIQLFSSHQPIKEQSNSQKQVNLIDIAKIIFNYKPNEEQQSKKLGGFGKQLAQKYQMMQEIFPNESKQELLQFIGNHIEVPYDDLAHQYISYKHW